MDLGAVLREARQQAGLTQQRVAEVAGVTTFALCRWETGARPIRSDVADRILLACGADLRLRLVPRLADLDASLDELAALSVQDRVDSLRDMLSVDRLDALQASNAVVFCGAWAALALGLPSLTTTGGLLLSSDPGEQARVSTPLRSVQPLRIAPGGPWSVTWDEAVFERNPSMRLYTVLLGTFTCDVVAEACAEQRLQTEHGPWRVVIPDALVPEVVDAAAVERWRERAT